MHLPNAKTPEEHTWPPWTLNQKGQHNCLDDEFKLIVKNPYYSSLSELRTQ
jgi:hypothetical protein